MQFLAPNSLAMLSCTEASAGADEQGNAEELQYLSLIQNIIRNGAKRPNRTGTDTIGIFGAQLRFSLTDNVMPLLTTKRVFWKGVVEELLWFIRGDTNSLHLSQRGVHIWDANGSREFLEKRGLGHREEGDLGPVYGFQWRHFGAPYTDFHADYAGQGVDQLAQVIEKLKKDPFDRRIVMTAWNPKDLPLMALPPCHMFAQFYASPNPIAGGKLRLSCQMYQRSVDVGLGMPFNIASYALLTRMIAHVVGMEAWEFVHTCGDTHIYENHIEALQEQIKRIPRPFPRMNIKVRDDLASIDGFRAEDFELLGYRPHDKINMKMAV